MLGACAGSAGTNEASRWREARLNAAAAEDRRGVEVASTRRILIIDDNIDAADLTAEILRLHNIDVDVAYGGLEGVAAAKALMPDMIFLDIGMPIMDGYAVAKALRGEAALSRMKIVALTAWGDHETREQTRAAGFDMHIVKPAQFGELIDIASGTRLG